MSTTCPWSIEPRCSALGAACSLGATQPGDLRTSFGPWRTDTPRRSTLTITTNGSPEEDLRKRLSAPTINPSQGLYVSDGLPQTKRVMVKDEDVCLHCGLCAERCPTAAWDMVKFDLLIPYAGKG